MNFPSKVGFDEKLYELDRLKQTKFEKITYFCPDWSLIHQRFEDVNYT